MRSVAMLEQVTKGLAMGLCDMCWCHYQYGRENSMSEDLPFQPITDIPFNDEDFRRVLDPANWTTEQGLHTPYMDVKLTDGAQRLWLTFPSGAQEILLRP